MPAQPVIRRLPPAGAPPVTATTSLYVIVKAGAAGLRVLGVRMLLGQVFSAIESQVHHLLLEGIVQVAPSGATAGEILTSHTTPALPTFAVPSWTPPS